MCCEMKHRLHQMFCIVFVFFHFIANCILHALAKFDIRHLGTGLFQNSPEDMEEKYGLLISPADWTYAIWGAVYVLQLIWLIFALTTLCRQTEGGYLYFSPPLISTFVYIFFALNLGANIACLFMWDQEELEISAALMAGCCLFLYLALALLMFGLKNSAAELRKQGKKSVIVDSIILSFNAFAANAAFTTILTVFHAATAVQYVLGWDPVITANAAICIIAFELFVYVLIDFSFFEQHFRFVFTPYLVLGVVLAGILSQIWDLENEMVILLLGLSACTVFAFVAKIAVAISKGCRMKLYAGANEKYEKDDEPNPYVNDRMLD